jgi:hypothetical protein
MKMNPKSVKEVTLQVFLFIFTKVRYRTCITIQKV